jgi:hypothetical protein
MQKGHFPSPYTEHMSASMPAECNTKHCLRNGFDAGADRREVTLWEMERSRGRGAVSAAIKYPWGVFAAIRLHHRHLHRVVAAATGGERRTPRVATSQSERPERSEEGLLEWPKTCF